MKKIYYIGDSIVAWNPSQEYIKYGIPGYTTADMAIDLEKEKSLVGDSVILSIGVNDIISHYPKEKSFKEYQKIFSILRMRFSKIIVVSILPTNFLQENPKILDYNFFLESNDILFLNLYSNFLDEKKERIAPQYTTDGIHLSRLGYEHLNDLLRENLKRLSI